MTKYLLVYHGGRSPQSKEEGERVMKEWMDWMGSLGPALAEVGNPTAVGRLLHPDGTVTDVGSEPATGYSILEAANTDAALALARGCPHLKAGGSVEVAEITPVM